MFIGITRRWRMCLLRRIRCINLERVDNEIPDNSIWSVSGLKYDNGILALLYIQMCIRGYSVRRFECSHSRMHRQLLILMLNHDGTQCVVLGAMEEGLVRK